MTTALAQPWAERLAWTLLHFIWQGTLWAAIYTVARLAAGRVTARARYAMACAALLGMALSPAATYWWLAQSGIAASPTSALTPPNPQTVAAGFPYAADPWQAALPWIVMAWFAGVAACSVRLAAGWISVSRLRSSHNRPPSAEWQHALQQLSERMRVRRPVRLLVSDRVESLSVIGWLRPVILAPLGLLAGLAPDHVEALLAHELAHVRRHDYLVNLLQGIAESLLFYHPAVWWISGQIRAEREHCCDDLAVAASGDVLTYARALAELESARPAHFNAALAANDGSLVRRIRRLIDPAAHAPSRPGAAWILSVLLLVAIGAVAMRAAQPASVARDSIWLDTVKLGDVVRQVRALGVLTSAHTAELRVAETQMKEVAAGQPVTIAFQGRKDTVPCVLTRVRPGVANGVVTVDVQVEGPLPAGIAAQSPVDATITIGRLSNVVHVARPVIGKANSEGTLFKIEPDGQTAVRINVQYGETSVNTIEIKSGLQPGDKVIVSDMSAYDKYDRVTLK
uniref:Peptidase M56, BlaR1 n=1 Tax=Solibacter usitatus (strain Ellin6076) TaxID=234267 RepID=Q024E3_SOLUE